LAVRAAGWGITRAPVLGDQAYGDDSKLRVRLHEAQVEYVLSVSPTTTAFEAGTRFEIPPANPARAGRRASPRPTTSTLRSRRSLRACPLRRGRRSPTVIATASRPGRPSRSCAWSPRDPSPAVSRGTPRVSEEWLIVERPEGKSDPSDYWLSNLPADTAPEWLARLARLRWMIDLDYRQLKGELGLDH
jgi:SRSO17 transposase